VHFIDAEDTVDDVMREINDIKRDNGAVILADGSEMAANGAGGPRWRELAGVLTELFLRLRAKREEKMGISSSVPLTWDVPPTSRPVENDVKLPTLPRTPPAGVTPAKTPLSEKLKGKRDKYVLDASFQRTQSAEASSARKRDVSDDDSDDDDDDDDDDDESDDDVVFVEARGPEPMPSVPAGSSLDLRTLERDAGTPADEQRREFDDDEPLVVVEPVKREKTRSRAELDDLTQDSDDDADDAKREEPLESGVALLEREGRREREIDLTQDSDDDDEASVPEEWSCERCTYRHAGDEALTDACMMCNTRRSGDASSQSASRDDASSQMPLSLDYRYFTM